MKKVLVLTPRYPYPVIGGDRLRIYQQCKELSKKYKLTLLSLCESKDEMDMALPEDNVFEKIERVYLPKWKSYLNCLLAIPSQKPLQVAYYSSTQFRKKLKELRKENDLLFAHLVRVGDYIKDDDIPKVLEMTDAISMNYERVRSIAKSGGMKNMIYSIEQNRLNVYEQSIVHKFDLSLLVSDVDRQYLYSNDSEAMKKVTVCSNGVDVNSFPFKYSPDYKTLVFIGNMTSVQNFDAAKWFAAKVMPLLTKTGVFIFKVVGKISFENKNELEKYDNVVVTGSVDNIPDNVQGALAGVCPMRLGAGVQNKVLEYMSLGLPAISSTLGYEGILAKKNQEILVADTPEQYCHFIKKLIDEKDFAKFLSENGRHFVEREHDWSAMLAPMMEKIDKII